MTCLEKPLSCQMERRGVIEKIFGELHGLSYCGEGSQGQTTDLHREIGGGINDRKCKMVRCESRLSNDWTNT